ncbi:MAG: polysaccharide deacetylase family protein [Clostridiales bacterium]|nr:polysaccharide deacetylase family protein [Clostridiales bacterium]
MRYKPKLIIQIDCDSEFVIKNHYGLSEPINHSYYSALKIFFEKFKRLKLQSTLFVVGKDINHSNSIYLLEALDNGHEIANHSFSHCANFSMISKNDFIQEVHSTNEVIKTHLGVVNRGFRAPNFNINLSHLDLLEQEGIQYDCSFLMTPFSHVLSRIKKQDANDSRYLADNYKNCKEYLLKKCNKFGFYNNTIEIPISVFPCLKFPCHFSYLLATNKYLAQQLIRALIRWHTRNEKVLIYLFHLADIVENEFLYGTELKWYKSLEERLFLLDLILELFSENFDSLTTYEYLRFMKDGNII